MMAAIRMGQTTTQKQKLNITDVVRNYELELRGSTATREGLGPVLSYYENVFGNGTELYHVYVFGRSMVDSSGGTQFHAFYQLPFSDTTGVRRKRLCHVVRQVLKSNSSASRPCPCTEQEVYSCNDRLAESPYILDFNKFRIFKDLFDPQQVDPNMCLRANPLKTINKDLKRLLGSDLPTNYPQELFDFERKIFFNKYILVATNLFHAFGWIATLLIICNNPRSAGKDRGLRRTIFRLRPLLSEKMFHLIHEGRFLAQPLGDARMWAMGELHHLACGHGATDYNVNPSALTVEFSPSGSSSSTAQPWQDKVNFNGKEWSVTLVPATLNAPKDFFDAAVSHVNKTLDLVNRTQSALLGNARAAIMSRNMSHNIGSHALAGVLETDIEKRPRDVDVMLRYLQERMDFVARVATEWPSWRQPQLFFRDLVMGWARQGLLLDRLVKDDGYEGKDIELHVKLPSGNVLELEYPEVDENNKRKRSGLFLKNPKASVNDVMVAIPGGRVGRQAFYGFLENAVRNAAKHNTGSSGADLIVQLEIEDAATAQGLNDVRQKGNMPPAFLVRYRDNLSPDGTLCNKIQKKLTTPLIDPGTGQMTPQDWGIQEMKVYADYLAHPFTGGERELFVHEKDGERYRLWCGDGASPGKNAGQNVLEYRFLLQRPTLALVCGDSDPSLPHGAGNIGVLGHKVDFQNLEQAMNDLVDRVAETSPSLLYIECPADSFRALLQRIKDNELFLPARILIRVDNGDDANSPRDDIKNEGLVRRVYLDEESGSPLEGQDAENLLVELYRRWLLAFGKEHGAFAEENGEVQPVNLVVYFARTDEAGEELAGRWVKLGEDLAETMKDLVNVFPLYQGNRNSDPPQAWSACTLQAAGAANLLSRAGTWYLIDGHHFAKDALFNGKKKLCFYQYMGHGGDGLPTNRDLFDLMANPPQGTLTGAFFLVTLVESALLDVVVVDERVASNLFTISTGNLATKNPELLFLFDSARVRVPGGWRSIKHNCYYPLVNVKASVGQPTLQNVCDLVLDGEKASVAWSNKCDKQPPVSDVLVIHRGVVETLSERVAGVDCETIVRAHRGVAARVVVTSGRGAQLRGVLGQWPFVEFATIDAYVGRELSKPSLAAVLMSVTGKRRKQ